MIAVRTSSVSSHQQHLFYFSRAVRLQRIIIHAARKTIAVEADAIRHSGNCLAVEERRHFLTQRVVDGEPDAARSLHAEFDLRRRIEGVRIILSQFECTRELLRHFNACAVSEVTIAVDLLESV